MDKKELVQQVIANLAEAQQGWLSDSLAQMGAKTRMQAQDILRVDLSFSEQIRLGSVVTVRNEKTGIRTTYFILPGASGMTVQTENEKVTVISPNTPIAKGILMKRSGERCAVPTPSGTQFIVIESIS